MREFNYNVIPNELFCSDIMNLVSAIHEYKGKQELFIEAKPDILNAMLEIAKIQSIGASNRIEGIYTSDERLDAIVKEKAEPRNRSESEIAGYREVLQLIHENYDYMPPRVNVILQLHRDLYQFSPSSSGGNFKKSDNIIAETDPEGNNRIRFQPLSAFETPDAMERLTNTFVEAINAEKHDPLLLIPMFVLDFLCIHPFNDGNGRMSRLLTLLLLYRSGYIVGKYISLEMIIEKTKETYYETLQNSSQLWHENKNDNLPFVKYCLGIILNAYKEFSSRVEHLQNRSLSKPERIRLLFDNTLKRLSKRDILEKCPDISTSTIEVALAGLLKEGYIIKTGAGKKTAYIRNTEQAQS
ncbi:Fic family protein [Anaerobacterium chartisolvens]|uniref:Fic family protein n=1 Tax=Anaerobacterium chartisolvens TaxID=1297424 RepID=A0A369AY68_9FIRM|nr:Fic family protein [Anaerobacterium chartisolvens]RCX14372.1 Fic family protein [Anaerobacterium chartisolvens]